MRDIRAGMAGVLLCYCATRKQMVRKIPYARAYARTRGRARVIPRLPVDGSVRNLTGAILRSGMHGTKLFGELVDLKIRERRRCDYLSDRDVLPRCARALVDSETGM